MIIVVFFDFDFELCFVVFRGCYLCGYWINFNKGENYCILFYVDQICIIFYFVENVIVNLLGKWEFYFDFVSKILEVVVGIFE